MLKSVIIIPAYNAAKTIKSVIGKVDRTIIEDIIVLNDGSNDQTEKVLNTIDNIKVLHHESNKGYGFAMRRLYEEAYKYGYDLIITLHADIAHNPSEIPNMLQPLYSGVADVVVGDRTGGILNGVPSFMKSKFLGALFFGPMPAYKLIFTILITKFQNICYGTNLHAFHSGFRSCNRKTLEIINFQELTGGYCFDTEFLLKANAKKLRIKEVPVTSYYSKDAGSNVPVIRYGYETVLSAIKYWLKNHDRKR